MLKALELHGFKSFADKTRFEFPDGITVVVGPNGSGKSNVVDGIRWVLGEQSAKSLRGTDMSDVIFKGSGTGQRRQANTAEVTIVFDNSKELLSLDSPEVRVTRRVYRSGEGEYLINDEPCRLRDIRDLFRGTGVGADAYSLIEQGKVDTLLQASPRERRAIFEEAAGISRFKAKKVEAKRRLDRVEQNLLRLNDIVDEVERRLKSLRNQATKARRYREYTDRLKELRTHVSLTDFLEITEESSVIETQLAELATQIETLQTGCQESDEHAAEIDDRMEAIKHETRQVSNQVSQIREQIAGIETTSQLQRETLAGLENETAKCRRKLSAVNSQAGDMQMQLREVQQQCSQVEKEFEEVQSHAEEHQTRLREITEQLQGKQESERRQREQHAEQMRSVTRLNSQLSSLESELTLAASSMDRDKQRGDELAEQLDEATKTADESTHAESELRKKLSESTVEQEKAEQQLAEVTTQFAELSQQLAECRQERAAAAERSNVLEEVERRLEGIGAGTKDLLARAKSGAPGPVSEIRGMVADLIEVKVEMAPLVDAALGERAQYIVAAGQRLMHAIGDSTLQLGGRVGIISLSTLNQERFERDPKLASEEGVLGHATDFVQMDSEFTDLANYLLGTTWFVRTTEVALSIRERYRQTPWRFVTTWGEVLEANGTFFGGPRLSSGGIVSRRSELRSLQLQVAKLNDQERELDSKLHRVKEQKDNCEAQFRKWNEQRKQSSDEFANVHAKAEAARQVVQQLTAAQNTLQNGLSELQQRHADLSIKQTEALAGLGELEGLVSALESALGSDRKELAALREEHQLREQDATETKIELAKVEQRLETLRMQALRCEQDNDDRAKAVSDIQSQMQECGVRFEETTQAVLSATSNLAETYLSLQEYEQTLRNFRAEEDEISAERATRVSKARQWRDELHQLQQSEQALQLHAGELRMKKDNVSERLRDDYGIELSELVEEYKRSQQVAALADESTEAEADVEVVVGENGTSDLEDVDLEDADQEDETTSELEGDDSEADEADSGEEASGEQDSEDDDVNNEDDPAVGNASEDSVVEEPTNRAQQVLTELQAQAEEEEQDREEIEAEISSLRRKLNNMGAVNMESVVELDDLESRYGELSEQYQDLVKAKEAIERIIQRINVDSRQMFEDTLNTIRESFQGLFRRAFGGGQSDIVVEEDVDILEAGIDIVATPPGKQSLNISLLSGGERALTAVTLLLAIFRHRPSPFCILDEVDGPLDEANIGRFVDVLHEFLATTKVVIVTHSKKTMSAATTLYGVTMQESGVSKRVSVQFNDVREDGSIRAGAGDEDAA